MIKTCIYIFKIILKYFFFGQIIEKSNFKKLSNTLCIIGNGPSLNKDLRVITNYIDKWDIIVVNNFSNYKEYSLLRPKQYVLTDSTFWDQNLDYKILSKTKKTISNIINLTSWSLNLYVPLKQKSYFVKVFSKNKNIKICGLRLGGMIIQNKFLMKLIIKKRLSFLPNKNIVHMAIQIGFFYKYKKIHLFGIDSDVFKSFFVDQKTNRVYTNYDYYNVNHTEKGLIAPKKFKKLSERLDQVSDSFKIYDILAKQASFENIQLFNCSSFSMVDTLERKKFN
mgnify:CR=1 FL=1